MKSLRNIVWFRENEFLKKKNSLLVFNPTNRCQSKCLTCYAWKYLNKDLDKELKIDEIEKICDGLKPIQCLNLTGGEPFLRPDLDEVVEVFYRKNKVRNVVIPTNAIANELIVSSVRKVILKCPKINLLISLSLDGIGEAHDKIRGYKNNFELLRKTYKALVELKKEFPCLSLKMNTCLNSINIREIDKIFDFVPKEFSALDFHSFEFWNDFASQKQSDLAVPPYEKTEEIFEKIFHYWRNNYSVYWETRKIVYAFKMLTCKLEVEILKKKQRKTKCFAGTASGAIYAGGDVSVCETLPPMGNIRNADFDFGKLWYSEKATKQREMIKNLDGPCTTCRHTCVLISSLYNDPLIFPKLLKYLFKAYR